MTTAADIDTFDPRSNDYLADPYRHLARVRASTPVVRHEASGHWFLLRYDDVSSGLADIARNTDLSPGRQDRRPDFVDNPFAADGAPHTGPRRLITPTFTNRAVQRFRERAGQIVDRALDGKAGGSELRVVDEIGYPLPYLLTCEILGVPETGNVDELRDWTWKSLALLDVFLTPEEVATNNAAARSLAAHIADVVEWKRHHLGDDVASTVIAAADEGTVMVPAQVVPFLHTLYLAGMHTTVNQTALSLRALLEHRRQWDLLVDHPDLLENAVEELLRFEPTAQYMLRTTYADFTFGDTVIPEASDVICWIASANRDPGQWGASADDLDITRSDARYHLAFGKGPHTCIGSWLARLELHVVLGTLISRYPRTELSDQELVWSSNVIRGPDELILRLAL